jgi:hypothetical protein
MIRVLVEFELEALGDEAMSLQAGVTHVSGV